MGISSVASTGVITLYHFLPSWDILYPLTLSTALILRNPVDHRRHPDHTDTLFNGEFFFLFFFSMRFSQLLRCLKIQRAFRYCTGSVSLFLTIFSMIIFVPLHRLSLSFSIFYSTLPPAPCLYTCVC